jgi:peptidoglycan/LPS O-acetylase OafA/YrhL
LFDLNWHYSNGPVQIIGFTLNAIFWGGIIGLFTLLTVPQTVPFRVCALAGKYSYGMYVFHFPVMVYLQKFLRPRFPQYPNIALAVLGFTISVLLAVLSYHFFEKYFFKLRPVFGAAQKAK